MANEGSEALDPQQLYTKEYCIGGSVAKMMMAQETDYRRRRQLWQGV
jgi:hypothetical protein